MLGSIELRLSGAAKEFVPMPKGSPESSGMSFADYLKESTRDVYDPFEKGPDAAARQKEVSTVDDPQTETNKKEAKVPAQAATEQEPDSPQPQASERTDGRTGDTKRAQNADNQQSPETPQANAKSAERSTVEPGSQTKPGDGTEAEKLEPKLASAADRANEPLARNDGEPESDVEASLAQKPRVENAERGVEQATLAEQSESAAANGEEAENGGQVQIGSDAVPLTAEQVRSTSPVQQGKSPETLAAVRAETSTNGPQVIQVIDLRTASGRLQALRQELRGEARVEARPGSAPLVQGTQASTPIGPSNVANTSAFALEQLTAQDSELAERLVQNLRLGPLYGSAGPAVHQFLGGALPFNAGLLRLWGQAGGFGPNHQNPTNKEAEIEPGTVESAQQVQRLQVETRAVQAQTGAGSAQANLQEFLKTSGAFEIVRSAKFILKDNDRGQIKLILKPEHLGEVRIDIQLDNNRIGGTILVDNKEVEEAFLQTMEDLKAAFVSNGFESPVFQIENRENGNSTTENFLNYGIDLAV